ncbi:hypothetical protein [Methylobacterium frigidaeris]|uniref:hypothetical protein n=1 Tax=Methylobacterium frigidaeris TaxID=2038277 RepID=UPI001EDE0D6C|nr:hypothetical protein [Methylobacterium frigidaeris]
MTGINFLSIQLIRSAPHLVYAFKLSNDPAFAAQLSASPVVNRGWFLDGSLWKKSSHFSGYVWRSEIGAMRPSAACDLGRTEYGFELPGLCGHVHLGVYAPMGTD